MLSAAVIMCVIMLLFASLPIWPYSRSWGYLPSAGPGLATLVMFILLIFGML